jgi:hypothetical protein
MIVIAGIFTPRFQRDLLKGDLIENLRCNSRREYAWCIGEQVLGVIRSQMRAAFDPWLLVGEAAFLYIPLFMDFSPCLVSANGTSAGVRAGSSTRLRRVCLSRRGIRF